ncbi:MAG: ATP-dependent sacrificial sulfur transferase LarE [Methylobacteriaceae bacterium]|nr:ATP-dependent sacrificial sulfur transferase LarE [Methylobacteriaceae bacterium]
MPALEEKRQALIACLKDLGGVAVAFSGGVDSTLLLKIAHDTLGEKAVALTARSASFPLRELNEAKAFCEGEHIRHILFDSGEMDDDRYTSNPVNRCYLCKSGFLAKAVEIAHAHGIPHVAEGSNVDDMGDYRPGLTAVAELGVKSPLRQAGLTKADIRALSRELGLKTWNKPSFACLSSRIPYGEKITPQRLAMIDKAEQFLLDMGIVQVRVRAHGNLARIETDGAGMARIMEEANRKAIHAAFRGYGFAYVSLDLMGYRTGSMNEPLKAAPPAKAPEP